MRTIIVCVDYWDYLDECLPYNRHHFEEVLIVTSPQDTRTQHVCENLKVPYFITDAFYRNGAKFNKWLALEEGLDYFGRHGWITILDADIVIPKSIEWPKLDQTKLYGPERYMSTHLLPEEQWKTMPLWTNKEFSGFFQMFHASCPFLPDAPWHQTNWTHAGGADTFFQQNWPASQKVRLPFPVLHIGPNGKNWCGRVTPFEGETIHPDLVKSRQDAMRKFMLQRRNNPDPNYTSEKLQ